MSYTHIILSAALLKESNLYLPQGFQLESNQSYRSHTFLRI